MRFHGIAAAFLLGACGQAPTQETAVFAREALYYAPDKSSAVSFGERVGIGSVDRQAEPPASLRFQEWSEPARDCSTGEFRCVSAGDILIFLPVGKPAIGRTYRHRHHTLRAVACDAGGCTFELRKERDGGSGKPVIYMRTDSAGIKSLGFGMGEEDPAAASQQFERSGAVGLFGPT